MASRWPEQLATRHHYDKPSSEHTELSGVRGQLAWVEHQAGSVYFGYDNRGRRTKEVRRWNDGAEHASSVVLNNADQIVARTYPDGSTLRMTYAMRGKLAKVGPILPELTWTSSGKLERMTLGNGVVDERRYDGRLRENRREAVSPAGEKLRALSLSLDGASHVTAVADLREDIAQDLNCLWP